MRGPGFGLALALSCAAWGSVRAEISDNVVRIGVLNDISGIFQDTNGMGSVEAARMAAEDFNGGASNIKVEIVYADHQNKAEVKKPEESKYPYDYYRLISTIPADQAFRPIADGGCSLVK